MTTSANYCFNAIYKRVAVIIVINEFALCHTNELLVLSPCAFIVYFKKRFFTVTWYDGNLGRGGQLYGATACTTRLSFSQLFSCQLCYLRIT